jgi:peptidylprolyl isomerase
MTDGAFPGLLEGLEGMKVGGRRAIVIPPDQGFGTEGNPQMGLPAATDIVMVVDLLGAY